VSKTVNDISLIKKYLAGKLDARAMHELERRALDDPFLADALEGYGNAAGDQQKNLADLSARLRDRTDKKVRALTPWRQLSIAASLLVIIGLGAWLVIRSQNAKQDELKQVAVNIPSKPKQEQPTVSAPAVPLRAGDTIARSHVKIKHGSDSVSDYFNVSPSRGDAPTSQPPVLADIQTKRDSTTVNFLAAKSPPANAYSNTAQADKQAPTDVLKSNPAANDALVQSLSANKPTAKKTRQMVPETLLSARADNVDVKPALRSGSNYTTLVGYVTGNNQPLAGAIVKMAGANFGVATDANGRFELHNVPDNKSLVVKSLGFATKQVKVNGSDSINVSLDPNMTSLAEVAIAKPAVPNTNDDKSSGSTGVHPGAGWKALNDYLNKNAVSPDGKTGKVALSFAVDGKGAISGFKVIQSLGNTADQKAIDLIINGPAWAGNIDGQPHEVKVTVNFH